MRKMVTLIFFLVAAPLSAAVVSRECKTMGILPSGTEWSGIVCTVWTDDTEPFQAVVDQSASIRMRMNANGSVRSADLLAIRTAMIAAIQAEYAVVQAAQAAKDAENVARLRARESLTGLAD